MSNGSSASSQPSSFGMNEARKAAYARCSAEATGRWLSPIARLANTVRPPSSRTSQRSPSAYPRLSTGGPVASRRSTMTRSVRATSPGGSPGHFYLAIIALQMAS